MPKLFSIGIEVEEIMLGHVIRNLNRMNGVAKIKFDLSEKKTNGAHHGVSTRQKFGMKAEEFVVRCIHDEGPLATPRMRELFAAAGRKESSVASAVHHAQHSGMIVKDNGAWALTRKTKDRLRHQEKKKQ